MKIEAHGEGAVVTYARGEPPNVTTYPVRYTKVINAGVPTADANTAAQPSAPKAGKITEGLQLAPQEDTQAPIWSTKGDTVRVMGPAAGGISGTNDQNEVIRNRGNSIPRRADSPDPRVMEATGVAVDRANGIGPDGQPIAKPGPKTPVNPSDPAPKKPTEPTGDAPIKGSHKGADVYPVRTDGPDNTVAKYTPDELRAGLVALEARTGLKVAAAKVDEVSATEARITVKVKTEHGDVDVVVTLKVSDSLNPADAHGGDGGAARFTLDREGGQWKATVSLAQGLNPKDIKFVVGHELDEIADLAQKHPAGKKMQTGEPSKGKDANKAHDIAAANEVVALWRELQELKKAGDGPDVAIARRRSSAHSRRTTSTASTT